MAAVGLYKYECAKILGIDHDTFVKYYNDDYELGLARTILSVGAKVVKQAQSDRPTAFQAQQLFLKTRGRWMETKNVEVSGPNGGAIPVATIDLDALDYEELETLDAILSPAMIEGEALEPDEDDDEALDA